LAPEVTACSRRGVGILDPPLDGGPPVDGPKHVWTRTGDTFETLTLRPSILRMDGCRWHGFVTNGEVETL